jgi:hypothetical protein
MGLNALKMPKKKIAKKSMYKLLQHCKLDTLTTLVLNLNHGINVVVISPKAHDPLLW